MKARILALTLAAALCGVAQARKPGIAVLFMKSYGDDGRIGKFVRKSLQAKLARTYQYETLFNDDVDNAGATVGFKIKWSTPPDKVGAFAANTLQCRFVVWGAVTRAAKGWIIRVKAMDIEKSKTKLTWAFNIPVTRYREVPLACVKIIEEISGFKKLVGMEPIVPKAKRFPEPRPNLLKNGGFEQGGDTPANWQRIDNLTTFWERDSKTGRGLLVDTDVLEDEVMAWRKRLAAGADFRKPPKKTRPTRRQQYKTIGATYGIHFESDPIPVKRGVIYRLSADVKGRTTDLFFPKIFVKGYAPFGKTRFDAQDRSTYRMYLACRSETEGREFEHHTRTFLPNAFWTVFEFEDPAGSPLAAKAAPALRELMRKRNFPQVPVAEQRRRLKGSRSHIGFDTPIPEITVTVRDRLTCAHAIYGKLMRTEKGPTLCLRLMSARIKRNVPMLDLSYPVSDEASLRAACGKFLELCERRIPFVQYMRVIPYSYWPRGEFRYDNIVLTEEGNTLW